MAARMFFSTDSPFATATSGGTNAPLVGLDSVDPRLEAVAPSVVPVAPALELAVGLPPEPLVVALPEPPAPVPEVAGGPPSIEAVVVVAAEVQPPTRGARLAMASQRPVRRRNVLRSISLISVSLARGEDVDATGAHRAARAEAQQDRDVGRQLSATKSPYSAPSSYF
jgi:hypothetical protein